MQPVEHVETAKPRCDNRSETESENKKGLRRDGTVGLAVVVSPNR
jgi:hypothetical protein